MKLDDAAAHLEALGNPTRLKIYRTLVRAGEAGMPVGKLQERLTATMRRSAIQLPGKAAFIAAEARFGNRSVQAGSAAHPKVKRSRSQQSCCSACREVK
jgi:DNA-binding transcriptional ArsR family regulator